MSDLVTLRAGKLELDLQPQIGGAIARLDLQGPDGAVPVLRGCEGDLQDVLKAACFPLVPFVNRIRGGCFSFRGRNVRLSRNMKGDPSPLHGQGWRSAWSVESKGSAHARLRFDHAAGEWPWAYEAVQDVRLDDDGLTMVLTCRNRSEEPMPGGLGLHPYFPCSAGTRIDTRVTHAWTIDDQVLPVERVPATGRFDLADRIVWGQDLDHGFGGWGGEARMMDPGWPFDLVMSSPDAGFFQLYSPLGGNLFVAEPVTHSNAALNRPEEEWTALGMRILNPAEAMTLTMRLDVEMK